MRDILPPRNKLFILLDLCADVLLGYVHFGVVVYFEDALALF